MSEESLKKSFEADLLKNPPGDGSDNESQKDGEKKVKRTREQTAGYGSDNETQKDGEKKGKTYS